MDNNTLQLKFKQRLNKLSSFDYDNISCWEVAESFNKAQIEWVRRQVLGANQRKQGDASSDIFIDDLQKLLSDVPLKGKEIENYFETEEVPENYLYRELLRVNFNKDCCDNSPAKVFLADSENLDDLLVDPERKPSFEWMETFCIMINNKFRIYFDDFHIIDPVLYYYRKPRKVEFLNCSDIATGNIITVDVTSEFKDDIVEIIIDEAVAILSGDIENFNQVQRNKNNANINT